VPRLGEDLVRGAALRQPTAVHHLDRVTEAGDDPEVVRDEQHGRVALLGEPEHEIHDLGLGGHVERRGRLVGDEEGRVAGQSHRDHDALAHAARELMWVVVHPLPGVRDVDVVEGLDGDLGGLALSDALVQRDRLDQLVPDRVDGVQRRHRILEDHRDLATADPRLPRGTADRCP
jgi:hypothetical protein